MNKETTSDRTDQPKTYWIKENSWSYSTSAKEITVAGMFIERCGCIDEFSYFLEFFEVGLWI